MGNGEDVDLSSNSLHSGSPFIEVARSKYCHQHRPLYRAILRNDWKSAKKVIDCDPTVVRAYISEGMETALHIAALAKNVHFVKNLVDKMDAKDLEIQNGQGNTALCFAAADGNTKIAELMIAKNDRLPRICGPIGEKPIAMAASLGHRQMVKYLHDLSNIGHWRREEQAKLLTTCIASGLHDVALKMVQNDPFLIATKDSNEEGNGETALHVLARMPFAFGRHKKGLLRRSVNYFLFTKKAEDEKSQQFHAFNLLNFILEHVLRQEDCPISNLVKEIPGLLFVAAEVGNTEFMIKLIDYYPDLIWKVDHNNESIFHIAVSHRHQSIFNLLHEIGSIGSLIATYKDDDDNNLLHLAAKVAPQHKLNKVSGAALQMQRDILWYREVERIVQPSYRVMKNKNDKTPHDIFKEEHKALMKEGEDWMKHTANSCLLVATLIATVVFTAAFTVPGGLESNSGVPKLLNEPFFKVFAVSEGIAMFTSSGSILMFLFILTSRYRERDFLHSLPFMLMVGITTLFLSIAAMVVAFCTTIFLTLERGSTLIPIILALFSCIPTMFFLIKFPLLVDIVISTYVSRFLFRSDNRLFQEVRTQVE